MRLLPYICRCGLRCPVRIRTVCVCSPRHRESLPEAKMTGPNKTDTELDATRQRLRRYARLLDSGIGVPGTRWQIGIEALIGLIPGRSEEHTSELKSLMRISYAVFRLKNKKNNT